MQGSLNFKVALTEEELGLPAIDELLNMYSDWLSLSKESASGRKTRAANKKADAIFEEVKAFRLPPIKIQEEPSEKSPQKPIGRVMQGTSSNNSSAKSSVDGSETSSLATTTSEPRVRTLRPRSRTPSVTRQPRSVPGTPTQQSIRAAMKKTPDSTNSANVLSAALNQQHPSVSVTKIRQLLRADSAQKRRDEEQERSEQVRLQRKAKEERAEAQKKQLLEERAVTAKLKREQRLLHAAEVRKARERTKIEQKLREDQTRKAQQASHNHINESPNNTSQPIELQPQVNGHKEPQKPPQKEPQRQSKEKVKTKEPSPVVAQTKVEPEIKIIKEPPVVVKQPAEPVVPEQPTSQASKFNETFQKVPEGANNIDISICDETAEEQRKSPQHIAAWAKAPLFRDALVMQHEGKSESAVIREAIKIFGVVELPVALERIFGPKQAVNRKYMARTSSAVWSTPHRPLKRTSSDVLTPTDPKRPV